MKGIFECRPCDLKFTSREEKDEHRATTKTCLHFVKRRRLHGRRTYWCTIDNCNTPWGSKIIRAEHQERAHKPTPKKDVAPRKEKPLI